MKMRKTDAGLEHPIRCRGCSRYTEKGAKPQKGQEDSLFLCDECQGAENERAAAEAEKKARG
jgi:hypothetical protein